MKLRTIISIFLTAASLVANAQSRGERVYISTDRQIYIAGENIRCSAYCIGNDGRLSNFSMTAYLELHSSSGMAANGRAALLGGRGCAEIEIPRSLPTGNYSLMAYTKVGLMRENCAPAAGSRIITIINPYGSERVDNGVKIVDAGAYAAIRAAQPETAGNISASLDGIRHAGSTMTLQLTNNGSSKASLDVSIVRMDGIAEPGNPGLAGFLAADAKGPALAGAMTPDYEGEVINARVAGIPESEVGMMEGRIAFISAPGDKSDVYSSTIAADGTMSFYTSNINGNKDLICEIEDKLEGSPAHIEIVSPFVNVNPGEIPVLPLCEGMRSDILARSMAAQLNASFASEAISDYLQIRPSLLFSGQCRSYVLDDYTRFPTMEEVMVEFIPELRIRKGDEGKRQINVLVNDSYKNPEFSQGTALTLVDGVPIFDYEQILAYDPLLVQTVDIYTSRFFIGARYYDGIVNFVTYAHNLPSMKFTPDVRVVSFKGTALPGILNGMSIDSENGPDYRQTAFWHPLVKLKAGESDSYEFHVPGVPGEYILKIEGMDSKGNPIFATQKITITK